MIGLLNGGSKLYFNTMEVSRGPVLLFELTRFACL